MRGLPREGGCRLKSRGERGTRFIVCDCCWLFDLMMLLFQSHCYQCIACDHSIIPFELRLAATVVSNLDTKYMCIALKQMGVLCKGVLCDFQRNRDSAQHGKHVTKSSRHPQPKHFIRRNQCLPTSSSVLS